MTETFATILAALMTSAAPLSDAMPERYLNFIEPTSCVQQVNVPTGFVYTPNGLKVDVTYPSNLITEEDNLEFYTNYFTGDPNFNGRYTNLKGETVYVDSGYYYNLSGERVSLKNRGIARVGDPTTIFNGAAFAFNMYWHAGWNNGLGYESIACSISNIERYLEDKSFIPVGEPSVNDIVCYVSDNGIVNAGIIKEVYAGEANDPSSSDAFVKELSKYKVQSMWGAFGLYEHRGDLCPFVPKYATREVTEISTVEVAYYRRHAAHNFKVVEGSNNGTTHTERCECGITVEKSHKYYYRILSDFRKEMVHEAYCDCGAKKTEKHTFVTVNIGTEPYTYCTKCKWSKLEAIRPAKKENEI